MAYDATLHVKLSPEMDAQLKAMARNRGTSKGQLVREALSACYQTSRDDLPLAQRQALSAFEGGYISLGKLAEAMGMHALGLRAWLRDHGISDATCAAPDDADRA